MLALDSIELLERFTVDQYLLMMQAGVLPEGAPLELIDGVIVRKDRRDDRGGAMVVGRRHRQATLLLTAALSRMCEGRGGHVQSQQPLHVSATSVPEPDCMVIRGSVEDFAQRDVTGAEVMLVIEVAESSLKSDRETKSVLYASAGVPVYWIVNLVDRVIEVHTHPEPAAERYLEIQTRRLDDDVVIELPDGVRASMAVCEVLK